MKGVILAGGSGSRLYPLTEILNKHLLPVADKPMIYYPIETLRKLGITDILVILGGNSVGDIVNLLQDGRNFGVNITYRYQKGAAGIAQALELAEQFIGKQDFFAVILGDNIFLDDDRYLRDEWDDFCRRGRDLGRIILKEVSDPKRFGVAAMSKAGKLISIEEKPKKPKSNLAITGLYFYQPEVFKIIKKLKPSKRGELEISDLHRILMKKNKLGRAFTLGFWSDAGTFKSLSKASKHVEGISDKYFEED